MIEWKNPIAYIGGDIVSALVEHNQAIYGNENTHFIILDIARDDLPRADLWLCRDCLFHLPYRDIFLAMNNFLRSNIRYLLTSTHPECHRNRDVYTGAFRTLNLQLKPFYFSPPILSMTDWIEGSPVRRLDLWERDALGQDLASNKMFRRILKQQRKYDSASPAG
jgi:hypothetical protein